jgi:hypothetical protein
MDIKTIYVIDDKNKEQFKFVKQSDKSVILSDLKRYFGDISGITFNAICLTVIDDKILPLGSWIDEVYHIMRPKKLKQIAIIGGSLNGPTETEPKQN